MEISIFLARVLGLYLIIVTLFTFIRRKDLPGIMRSMIGERGTLLLLAIFTLIIGLLLVVSHNIWTMDWRVVITILGWLILLGGIFRLFFQNYIQQVTEWWIAHGYFGMTLSIILFLIGIFLTYMSFSQ